MDPVFVAKFTKMNDKYRQQVISEMEALHGGPQAWMQSVQPTLTLMEEVVDMAHSPAAQQGDTLHISFADTQFKIEKGDEPRMTGSTVWLTLMPALRRQWLNTMPLRMLQPMFLHPPALYLSARAVPIRWAVCKLTTPPAVSSSATTRRS